MSPTYELLPDGTPGRQVEIERQWVATRKGSIGVICRQCDARGSLPAEEIEIHDDAGRIHRFIEFTPGPFDHGCTGVDVTDFGHTGPTRRVL